jgi:DUF1016 N-terminal domain
MIPEAPWVLCSSMKKSRKLPARKSPGCAPDSSPQQLASPLLSDIRGLIEQARQQTARAVNSAMVGLYWQIGKRIRDDVLQEKRGEYGEQIVQTLSAQLSAEYPSRERQTTGDPSARSVPRL